MKSFMDLMLLKFVNYMVLFLMFNRILGWVFFKKDKYKLFGGKFDLFSNWRGCDFMDLIFNENEIKLLKYCRY